jgi:hypothetical protein
MRCGVVDLLNIMKSLNPRLKLGIYAAVLTVFALTFLPPLIAPYLDEWIAAQAQLPSHPDIVLACGSNPDVQLSRWFYVFKVAGAEGYANFDGRVSSPLCDRKFGVELKRANYSWRVTKVVWKG